MDQEIILIAQKVHQSLKAESEEQEQIFKLKRDIEKVWSKVDELTKNESEVKFKLESLQKEKKVLEQLLENGNSDEDGQVLFIQKLHMEKERLIKQHDQQQNHIVGLLADITSYTEKLKKLQDEEADKLEKIKLLKSEIENIKVGLEKSTQARKYAENALIDIKQTLESKTDEWKDKKSSNKLLKEEIATLEKKLTDQSTKAEKASKNVKSTQEKLKLLQDEYDKSLEKNEAVNQKQLEIEQEIQDAELHLKEIQERCNQSDEKQKKLQIAIDKLNELRIKTEEERADVSNRINILKKDIESKKRLIDAYRVRMEDAVHQKNILNKKMLSTMKDVEKQNTILRVTEGQKRNMDRLVLNYEEHAEQQRKEIYSLQKQTDAYIESMQDALRKYYRANEELAIKKQQTEEIKTKIADYEEKVKKQQQLYEVTVNERNVFSKKYIESKYQIENMKSKFSNISQSINTLKEEISSTNKKLEDKHDDVRETIDQKSKLETKLQELRNKIESKKNEKQQNILEIEKLNQIIREAEKEHHQQRKELEAVVNDRDILGVQLIKRNDELAALYEKIKIQQSMLNMGAVQYRDTVNEITILKLKVDELRKKKMELEPQIATIPTLQTEVNKLQKTLLREKSKIRVLSEELQHPMNVHRWRQLKGSDPKRYELIMALQAKQKQLIAKNEEIAEKDMLIQQKENLYAELKDLLQKQPGPEVAEQLRVYQSTLKKKKQQAKTMKQDLEKYINKVKEQREETKNLAEQLGDIRKQYFSKLNREFKRNELTVDDLDNFDLGTRYGSALDDVSSTSVNQVLDDADELEKQFKLHEERMKNQSFAQ